jgi:hypothetical protein
MQALQLFLWRQFQGLAEEAQRDNELVAVLFGQSVAGGVPGCNSVGAVGGLFWSRRECLRGGG